MPIDQIIKAIHNDHHKINLDPARWSEIEINPGGVYLHIGVLRPDGSKERTLITRSYYMEGDLVKFNVLGDGL